MNLREELFVKYRDEGKSAEESARLANYRIADMCNELGHTYVLVQPFLKEQEDCYRTSGCFLNRGQGSPQDYLQCSRCGHRKQ